MKCINSI